MYLSTARVFQIIADLPEEGAADLRGSRLYTRTSPRAPWTFRGTAWNPQDVHDALLATCDA